MYERYVADLVFESQRSCRNFTSIDILDDTMSPVKHANLIRYLPMWMLCHREVVML